MIEIVFKNGDFETWGENEYTDYKYDGKCFIIIKDGKWVGFYNIDTITYVTINRQAEEEKKNDNQCTCRA